MKSLILLGLVAFVALGEDGPDVIDDIDAITSEEEKVEFEL